MEINENMRAVAKDIIDLEINPEFLEELAQQFYEIAKKHGLRWGSKEESNNGTLGANPEWTMAKTFFLDTVKNSLLWKMLLKHPEHLDHYEKEVDDGADIV